MRSWLKCAMLLESSFKSFIAIIFGGLVAPIFFVNAQVTDEELSVQAQSQEWHRLLHLKKNVLHGTTSLLKDLDPQRPFFLNPLRGESPKEELRLTIGQMFGADVQVRRTTQCRYLARRDFILRKFKISPEFVISDCDWADQWLSKLNTEKVSMIFAAGYLDSAASSFGHTFLKLQNPKNQNGLELLDYGINYAARTDDNRGALYALYGLFGFFPGTYSMLPYHQMIKDYTNLEGRDLWEYQLDLTTEEVQRMLWHLLEIEGTYSDYYFLSDNCSFALLKLLEIARPGLNLASDSELYVIPSDTIKRIQGLVESQRVRKSLRTQWNEERRLLNAKEQAEVLYAKPQEMSDKVLSASLIYSSLAEMSGAQQGKEAKERAYFLARERATRDLQKKQKDDQTPHHLTAPHLTHGSAAVRGGLIQRKSDFSSLYQQFYFHFAFHDALSRHAGLSRFSELEVMGIELTQPSGQNIFLSEVRLLRMLSTDSVSRYELPLSWGFSLGAKTLNWDSGQRELVWQGFGALGLSYDLFEQTGPWTHFRFSQFLLVGTEEGNRNQIGKNVSGMYGVQTRLWWIPIESMRIIYDYFWIRQYGRGEMRHQLETSFDITQETELRVGLQRILYGSQDEQRTSLFIHQNF